MKLETIDLGFQGEAHVIACYALCGPEGVVLIDPGPSTTRTVLLASLAERGISEDDVTDVALTHIHLDHAGSAGWWALRGARIHVHPVGAPHVVDPAKLLSSATRIYGERMDVLWGDVPSAPTEQVRPVADGETIRAGGIELLALETAGHAWHHHAFVVEGAVFSGDAAGIRIPGNAFVDLPAPPPEFDLEAWRASLTRLRELAPDALYRTHFGPAEDPRGELEAFGALLEDTAAWARQAVAADMPRDTMARELATFMRERAALVGTGEDAALAYELANPREMSVDGLGRYWRKRGTG